MNVKRARAVYLVLIIIFLSVIMTSVYYLLGGFKEVKVYQLNPVNRSIAGKYFGTFYNDEAPREFGLHCKKLIEEGAIDGTLTIVTYHSDTLGNKEISQFIGITLSQEMSEIPGEFEVREFTSKTRFAVFLSMHVLVQPRPHKIESMLTQKAEKEGFDLENFFFELRYPDNSLSVEGWGK